MLIPLLIVFFIGYLCIAFEHPLRVDKTATALLLGMVMWCMYALGSAEIVPIAAPESFQRFLADNPSLRVCRSRSRPWLMCLMSIS